jgi:hypothetical protein
MVSASPLHHCPCLFPRLRVFARPGVARARSPERFTVRGRARCLPPLFAGWALADTARSLAGTMSHRCPRRHFGLAAIGSQDDSGPGATANAASSSAQRQESAVKMTGPIPTQSGPSHGHDQVRRARRSSIQVD